MSNNSAFWFANPSTSFYNNAIDQSLRSNDNDSPYLYRDPGSAGNSKTFTFSCWFKRCNLAAETNQNQPLFSAGTGATNFTLLYIDGANDDMRWYWYNGSTDYGKAYNVFLRDTTNWYHLVWAFDTTKSADDVADRVKVYVNGTRITEIKTDYGWMGQNQDMHINTTNRQYIGKYVTNSQYLDGYIAEANLIDGQQLEPTSFGELKNGVWIPKKLSGLTYGTNGFRLTFGNSSNIGEDSAGSNDYTNSSFVSSDVVSDSPENNFANLSVLNSNSNANLFEGGLRATMGGSGNYDQVRSDFGLSSGKWYWEVYIEERGYIPSIGVMAGYTGPSTNPTHWVTFGFGGWHNTYNSGISKYNVNQNAGGGTNWNVTMPANTNVVMVAIDVDNNKIWWGLNGTFYNSSGTANPATGADARVTLTANQTWHPILTLDTGASSLGLSNAKMRMNFGQDPSFAGSLTGGDVGTETDENGNGLFKYAPPSGYLACCTASLPDVTIGPDSDTQATNHFNTVRYDGASSASQSITTVGFKPDWIWVKSTSVNSDHYLYDSTRNADAIASLTSNKTTSEDSTSGQFTQFTATGFDLPADSAGYINYSGRSYKAWCWKANGGTTTTNDASATSVGTIDSVFQANTTSGFSIVSYTGTGSAGTVKHGLSVAPSLVIIKNRAGSSPSNWVIGQDAIGFTGQNYFTDTSAFSTNSGSFNNTAPTTSVVSIGTDNTVNQSTKTYIMYCFANVDGFSKIGKYEMNNSSDGTFVHLGFRPAWLLTRPVDQAGNWSIYDSVSDPVNDGDANMAFAGNITAESGFAASAVDFLSSGFKLRQSSDGYSNIASNTAIYMAFAEQPFKFSNAR